MIRLALLIIFVFLIAGCASVEQELKDNVFYEHAINMDVNGILYKGHGVVPLAPEYKIKIWGRGRMDFLRITSCHREITKNREGSRFKFNYIPRDGMEQEKDKPNSCLLYFESYEEKKGRNDWGILDFHTSFEKLWATSICNGEIGKGNVTLCHSRQGLKQKLVFDEPADLSAGVKPHCKITSKDGINWKYSMTKKVCILTFRDRKTKSKYHRHTNVGYEDVLIPAGE